MLSEIEVVHIEWEGPLTLQQVAARSGPKDFGLYQIYGDHPIYGSDTLLYVGKAQDRVFATRIGERGMEGWDGTYSFCLGRIGVRDAALSDENWGTLIERVEKLLVYAHSPAWNAGNIATPPAGEEYERMLVLNWGVHRLLLPEVSGARFTPKHWKRGRDVLGTGQKLR